jgi:Na+:H+ antiporter, NhaA family
LTTPAAATPANAFGRFFAHESAGGILLGLAALLALVVSNSPWAAGYERFLALQGTVRVGDVLLLEKPLLVWVNDLWMAVFFFLVGLEIKREFVEGELSARQQQILPMVAALGGMAVPAGIYALINAGDPVALRGWAIASATDIAFAIGVLTLLGSRVPLSLKVFLTAVAIIDDLGAIVIIALFYTSGLSVTALAGALVGVLLLVVLNRCRVVRVEAYVVVGVLIWLFVLKSGIHATLAGVVTALAIPVRDAAGGSPLQRVEHALHPWVAFLILPMFGFCNAGVSLAGASWAALAQPVTLGIALGLVVGKVVGVFGASWLAIRSGMATMPVGASTLQLLGIAMLCGIGFTMSLFIGGLAFEGQGAAWDSRVKIGVLAGSLVSAVLGVLVLLAAARQRTPA